MHINKSTQNSHQRVFTNVKQNNIESCSCDISNIQQHTNFNINRTPMVESGGGGGGGLGPSFRQLARPLPTAFRTIDEAVWRIRTFFLRYLLDASHLNYNPKRSCQSPDRSERQSSQKVNDIIHGRQFRNVKHLFCLQNTSLLKHQDSHQDSLESF